MKTALTLAVLAVAHVLFAETNVVVSVQEEVSVAELRAENEALRRENQRLRRELVRRQGGEPVINMEPVPAAEKADREEVDVKIEDDGGYWLATKSMKRHNSKCRYYKMGKGRPCKKEEGEPCKKCGG